jgi:hypothetical protein
MRRHKIQVDREELKNFDLVDAVADFREERLGEFSAKAKGVCNDDELMTRTK